ncbi:MAG: HDOD domain-containing protein [Planctomycetota bacterium]|nr:HDOD domain-containing protein [Planctomycetota bacterium]
MTQPGDSAQLTKLLQSTQLPALPQSAIRLMELARDPENGPVEFAVPIETDPGLSGQILKFVNSAYFGFSREISNIKMAITLVGIRTIKNFALWTAVFSLMPNPKCGPFDLKSLWQDSVRRGLFARAMAKLLGNKDCEEAFSAALLQDLAIPLLAKEMPKEYAELLEQRQKEGRRLSDLETERFGWNHADGAALIARGWKMPDDFALLLKNHIAIDSLMEQKNAPTDQLAVALSALLPSITDERWSDCGHFEAIYNQLKPAKGPTLLELLSQIDREFVEFAPVLKMAAPTKSLVAWYEESLAPAAG